jgi:hypothetical protein
MSAPKSFLYYFVIFLPFSCTQPRNNLKADALVDTINNDLTESTPFNYKQEENSTKYAEEYTFQSKGYTKFGLNDQTSFISESIRINEINSAFFYSMTNLYANQLYIYKLTERNKPFVTITFQQKDANAIGKLEPYHHHHYIVNLDSIYLLNLNFLYLLNHKGEIQHKVQLSEISKSYTELGFPNPTIVHPIIRLQDWLYIPCSTNAVQKNHKNHQVIIKYNIKTREFHYIRHLPEIYNQAYWGGNSKYRISISEHPDPNKLLLGFPIDPFVYEANSNGVFLDKKYVGSKYVNQIIPLSEDFQWPFQDGENKEAELYQYDKSTSFYGGLLYDPYHRLYYRFTIIRPLASHENFYQHSIIIMDEQLNKVGEKLLSGNKYSYTMKFISPDGLHIARRDLYQKDNKTLTYEIFKPIKVFPKD